MMYNFYLVIHFFLVMIWLCSAIIIDFRFLIHFKKLSDISQLNFLKNIQRTSDKTEFPASFFLILAGVLMIVDQRYWLKVGVIYWKIAMALVAIGLYHVSRGLLKKMISFLENNEPIQNTANRYMVFRLSTLVLLIWIFWLIIDFKGKISTLHFLKSLF